MMPFTRRLKRQFMPDAIFCAPRLSLWEGDLSPSEMNKNKTLKPDTLRWTPGLRQPEQSQSTVR